MNTVQKAYILQKALYDAAIKMKQDKERAAGITDLKSFRANIALSIEIEEQVETELGICFMQLLNDLKICGDELLRWGWETIKRSGVYKENADEIAGEIDAMYTKLINYELPIKLRDKVIISTLALNA